MDTELFLKLRKGYKGDKGYKYGNLSPVFHEISFLNANSRNSGFWKHAEFLCVFLSIFEDFTILETRFYGFSWLVMLF